mgnify:CR=1 FL=1
MEGWIKLYRKFIEWEWYNISEMVHLFIHLLLLANREPGEWRGIKINRGQLITGRNSLAEATGISQQTVRTCLNRLKSTSEITIKTTNKYSVITILKYEDYQSINGTINQEINQQTRTQLTNNQPTTNHKQEYKESKEVKNKEEELKARSMIFKNQVLEFKNKYQAIPTLKEFYEYWSEPNKSRTKMRFELQQTWDLSRRIEKWAKQESVFSKNKGNQEANTPQSLKITTTPIDEIR